MRAHEAAAAEEPDDDAAPRTPPPRRAGRSLRGSFLIVRDLLTSSTTKSMDTENDGESDRERE